MLTKHVWRSLETRSNHQLNVWNGSLPLWTNTKLTWMMRCWRSNARQVWALTNNGLFSFRSAYKLAMEMKPYAQVGSRFDGSHLRRFWWSNWSCNIPHKIRHFAWRACRDALPMKENLVRRKVLSDSCCNECKLVEETSSHLFWSC